MTQEPETFTSDKTGKKYKVETGNGILQHGVHFIVKEIIEPVLERGDWYEWKDELYEFKDCEALDGDFKYATEIRKADGQVWIKKDGVWEKK